MNRFLFSIFFFIVVAGTAAAQTIPDTLHSQIDSLRKDTSAIIPPLPISLHDSVPKKPRNDTGWLFNSSLPISSRNIDQQITQHNPYFGFSTPPITQHSDIKTFTGKEAIFYTLIFLLLLYAVLRQAFPKYFNDLFRLFFRTTIKQRQIREQLIQTPLPSLLLNVFFVISGAFYISFILQYFKLDTTGNFWLLSLYAMLGLAAVYFIKYLGLKISGWLFNMEEAANSYIFIVFVVNKMLGLLLLPFLILMAFTQGDLYTVSVTLSWCMVATLLAYRFVLTFAAVRNQVSVNPFHFFLYLCAFEIAPLLLIYKGLLLFLRITA